MTKAWSYISLFGDAFSPAVAEEKTGLSFHEKHGVGEYGTQGRFKNQPYPFGHASLEPPKGVSEAEQFAWLLDSILPHIETLRQLGVTGGRLHVTYAYDSQPPEVHRLLRCR